VVDPSFKDSFVLSNGTPAYAAVWQALPELFVGTAQHLVPLVEFLCTQVSIPRSACTVKKEDFV
jgi:uncharacterized protein (TIGR01615 family)